MKYLKLLILPLLFFAWTHYAHAALGNRTIWEINATSTASNVNGGGFNPENANFATDGTVTANTGNTATAEFSSASYNFVAGDANHYLFIKSNTGNDVFPNCWYKITSVASNKATLSSAAGSGECRTERAWATTTLAGISTAATPTNITWGLDYSRNPTAALSWVAAGGTYTNDLACTNVPQSVCSSAAAGAFGKNYIGNIFHVTAGTNATTTATGALWAECVSISAGACVLDHNITSAAANMTGGTARLGGSMSLNSTTDDDFFETSLAGMQYFIKYSGFGITLGETVAVGSAANASNPVDLIWYQTNRANSGMNNPQVRKDTINAGANTLTFGTNWYIYGCSVTGTAATMLSINTSSKVFNCKMVNTSTTADRNAAQMGTETTCVNCEFISYRGRGFTNGNGSSFFIDGCYIHDSNVGIQLGSTNNYQAFITGCVVADNVTGAVRDPANNATQMWLNRNTFYGAENQKGIGFDVGVSVNDIMFTNNIVYGFGYAASTTQAFASTTNSTGGILMRNNNYYNNSSTFVNFSTGTDDTFLDPQFTGVQQITGTGATSTTNQLYLPGANLSNVAVNQDFFTLISGTGTGLVNNTKYLITAVNDSTDLISVSSNITSSGNGSAITWHITTGHNFQIGTNLKGLAEPGYMASGTFSSYIDVGGLQRQEATGGSCSYVSYVCEGN